ncbi:MAG: glycosyltransferase [Candidatus Omnitrophota bacterium]
MNEPFISIIVASRNNAGTIVKCMRSLLSVDYATYEILIVNDGSTDTTNELLLQFGQRVKIIENERSLGPAQARNIAAQHAKGQYVAFTDADCIVDTYWLKELLRGFGVFPEVVSCGGAQLLPEDATIFEKKVFVLMKKAGFITEYIKSHGADSITEVRHNASCNVMYRRDDFLKIGGFLTGLWPGEDVELDYRLRKAGKKIVYNPKAVVLHYRPRDASAFLKMMLRYGWAQGVLVRKYGFFRKIHFLPILSGFLFGVFIILILNFSFTWPLFLAVFFAFLAYARFDFELVLLSVLGFTCWHFGFLKSLFLNGKRNQLLQNTAH